MKKRTIVMTVLVALLFASCVVKSLKPFYTKDTLAYDGSLVGKWKDNKNRIWEVKPMLTAFNTLLFKKGIKAKGLEKKIKRHNNDSVKGPVKVTIKGDSSIFKNKDLQEIYKKAYIFIDEAKGKAYVVVPFQIKGQMFLDFTPFIEETSSAFDDMHYVGIHTLAKLDKKGDGFKLSWLSENVMQELFKQKKIRIRHEKIGLDKEYFLLTASSDELQKFIAKYMDLEQKDKWDGTKLTFNRIK